MHEPVPQELVDMIIDDVGGGCGRVHRPPLKGGHDKLYDITYNALKNCALVARSWTHRSHMNLFKEIVFVVDKEEGICDLALPSSSSLKFINSLEVHVAPANPDRGHITLHLLTAFSLCPLEFLQIDGGLFSLSGRPALRSCFDSLSQRLLGLTFRFCLFEPEPLRDILSIQETTTDVMFLSCDQDHPDDPARRDPGWEPVASRRKLCVLGSEEKPSEEFLIDLSELSVKFGQLEVDFYEDGVMADATQRLIDTNAGVMSFLKINVISDSFMDEDDPGDAEALPPPTLSSCVNLSEFVLNMKGSYSSVVDISGTIFASLLEANCPDLSKIILEVEDAKSLFSADSREEYRESWEDLDSTLTMLAEKLMNAHDKKLIFVMEVTCEDDTIHRAKKWLPRFLPIFFKEGLLHVHDGENDVCYGRDYEVRDDSVCMSPAVLKEYGYESESDEKEADATTGSAGDEENQGGGVAEERKEDQMVAELDGGNEGDDEGEEEN